MSTSSTAATANVSNAPEASDNGIRSIKILIPIGGWVEQNGRRTYQHTGDYDCVLAAWMHEGHPRYIITSAQLEGVDVTKLLKSVTFDDDIAIYIVRTCWNAVLKEFGLTAKNLIKS